jgi:hypothetical protein
MNSGLRKLMVSALFFVYLTTISVAVAHITSNDMFVNNELERTWNERAWPNLRDDPGGVCLE